MERIAVIIPAYNEAEAIATVIQELCDFNHDLPDYNLIPVVVNDCSEDNTGAIADSFQCVTLHLPIRLGIGGAVQTGLQYAKEKGFLFAAQIDGDGQHIPSELSKMIEILKKGYDVVIGSRFIHKTGFQSSHLRRIGISYFKFLNKLLLGITVSDSTSGFRLFNRKAIMIASEYYPDEYPEPETVVLFSMSGLKIGETPVMMRDRMGGKSSIGLLASVYYMVKVTIAVFFTFLRTSKQLNDDS